MHRLVLVLALAAAAPALAQLNLPDLPDIPDIGDLTPKIKIPGLDRILKTERPLTNSFEDAVTGAPFLDDFTPVGTAPLNELARTHDYGFMIGPGAYDGTLESYCLNAGLHGPGSSEGYLWTRLRGPRAAIISRILRETAAHPELPQSDVQSLIWGILARCKLSDMSERLQQAARLLLTPQQQRELDSGALGMIPPELLDQAFGHLPLAVRQMMEAEARLRHLLTNPATEFPALERVAVLSGSPELVEGRPVVPRSRWSYHPGGYFVRYDPESYKLTNVQLVVPPPVAIEEDQYGRITAIQDAEGHRLETPYDDEGPVVSMTGDPGVTVQPFRSVRILGPEPDQSLELTLEQPAWTLLGTPGGHGVAPANSPCADLQQRYDWAMAHASQLRDLVAAVRKVGCRPASQATAEAYLPLLMNIANYHQALRQAGLMGVKEQWAQPALRLAQLAWMLGIAYLGDGLSYVQDSQALGTSPAAGRMLASLPVAGLPLLLMGAPPEMKPIQKPRFTEYDRMMWGPRPVRPTRPLRPFKPGGDEDQNADSAQSAEERQPTGQSNRPAGKRGGKESLEKAKEAIGMITKGKQVIDAVTDPVGTIAGQVGFGIHDQFQSGYFDWLFSTAETISHELGGDPPRPDFDTIATAAETTSEVAFGEEIPPARRAVLQTLTSSLVRLVSVLRAGQVTLDRLGGAIEAGDEVWEARQGAALNEHKRAAGEAFIAVADSLDGLIAELQGEGIRDIRITTEAYAAYQQRLRTEGFTTAELAAGHQVGLSDAEMESYRQERLSLDAQAMEGSLMAGGRAAAAAMRELGAGWARLPAYDLSDLP